MPDVINYFLHFSATLCHAQSPKDMSNVDLGSLHSQYLAHYNHNKRKRSIKAIVSLFRNDDTILPKPNFIYN